MSRNTFCIQMKRDFINYLIRLCNPCCSYSITVCTYVYFVNIFLFARLLNLHLISISGVKHQIMYMCVNAYIRMNVCTYIRTYSIYVLL